MGPLEFGDTAQPLWVHAYAGYSLTCSLVLTDDKGVAENWPAGTTGVLQLFDDTGAVYATFPATVSTSSMSWALSVSDVATMVTNSLAEISIDLSGNGTQPQAWFKGTVTVE